MTQAAKIIDISRSFVPIDSRVFPETLHATGKEDYPEERIPVVAYKGQNFLPTAQGYKSYFGTNQQLDFSALASRVDKAFIVQTKTFENILIALCEDGIWTKAGEVSGVWVHEITLPIPPEGSHLEWTYCIIGEEVFCYRATELQYYKFSPIAVNWEVNAFSSVATISAISQYTNAGGLPAETYYYSIASKNSSGALSAPSAEVAITLTVPGDIFVNISTTGIYGHRIYRRVGNEIKYLDYEAATITSIYDLSLDWQGPITLPDTNWEAIRYYAFSAIPVTPTFLNMEGQQGIFAAGIRLGFWDSENSVSWSSIDDFADFTPSVETLAGSAIFSDVNGRIINILSNEDGFVVYSTKSIVLVRRAIEATFQWDPKALLTDAGIAFLEQTCASSPDTTHFAWTSAGLAKIEANALTWIIPEVYDYLSKSQEPYFLSLLENRYLAIHCLDPDYLDGHIQLKVATVPSIEYNFDSTDVPDVVDNQFVLEGSDACYSYGLMSNAHLQAGINIINSGGGPGNYPDGPASQWLRSYYTAYFSRSNVSENPIFGPTPCPTVDPLGVEHNFCPVGDAGKLSKATQDATNKWVVEEVPGDPLTRFDPEQFMAWQLALWREEDKAREAFINAILSKSAIVDGVPTLSYSWINYANVGHTIDNWPEWNPGFACAIYPKTTDLCDLGDYIKGASAPFWGINACSFWLTRYITEKINIKRVKVNTTECNIEEVASQAGIHEGNTSNEAPTIIHRYNSPAELLDHYIALGSYGGPAAAKFHHAVELVPHHYQAWVTAIPPASMSPDPAQTFQMSDYKQLEKNIHEHMVAYNKGYPFPPGIYGVDTAYLQLKGWWYTDKNGVVRTIAASPSCTRPNLSTPPPKNNAGGSNGSPGSTYGGVPIGDDGTLCGIPFDPIQFENLTGETINWDTPSLEIPSGDFLLQKGSIGPIYPDFVGAYVYDLRLKKWGKYKDSYRRLLDYSPINSISSGIIPFEVFGIKGGCIKADGLVYLFDEAPTDSWLTYGKIGYYRQGFTYLEEIKVNFASPCQAQIYAEGSLDSKNLEASIIKSQTIDNENSGVLYSNLSARWFDITISGIFNLTHLEFRGVFAGRR